MSTTFSREYLLKITGTPTISSVGLLGSRLKEDIIIADTIYYQVSIERREFAVTDFSEYSKSGQLEDTVFLKKH